MYMSLLYRLIFKISVSGEDQEWNLLIVLCVYHCSTGNVVVTVHSNWTEHRSLSSFELWWCTFFLFFYTILLILFFFFFFFFYFFFFFFFFFFFLENGVSIVFLFFLFFYAKMCCFELFIDLVKNLQWCFLVSGVLWWHDLLLWTEFGLHVDAWKFIFHHVDVLIKCFYQL